jgi:hypothetical protein
LTAAKVSVAFAAVSAAMHEIFFQTTVAQSKFIVFLQRRCGYS